MHGTTPSGEHGDTDRPDGVVHIVFVRDTVAIFLPLLHSLLARTTLSFRVVSNGCTADEEHRLRQLCEDTRRLRFHSMRSAATLSHGEVLNRLFERETSRHFSVMDSDIFAIGPVGAADILPAPGEVARTSCLPIWHRDDDVTMPEGFRFMGGRFLRTETRQLLGCTYCASYDVAAVREAMRSTGVDFSSYWRDEVPGAAREHLHRVGIDKRFYDTAKVLNIVLQRRGGSITHVEIDNLVHLGGVSGAHLVDRQGVSGLRRLVRAALPKRLRIRVGALRLGLTPAEAADMADLKARRLRTSKLFHEVSRGPPYSGATLEAIRQTPHLAALREVYATFAEVPNDS